MIQLHQPFSEIMSWPYFEFEDYIKLLNERNEEERKQRESEEKKQGQTNKMSQGNYQIPNYKMPSFSPPKF